MGSKKSKHRHIEEYGVDTQTEFTNLPSERTDNNPKHFERIHSDRVTCLSVFDRDVCLSGSCDTNIALFDFNEGKLQTKWKGHDKDITRVCCGSNNHQKIVFSASRDKSIKIWQINDNLSIQLSSILQGHNLVVSSIDNNSDSTILCSGSRDNTIKLWDTQSNQCIKTNTITRNLITSVKWFPDGTCIAQTGEDKMLRMWDSRTLNVAFTFPPKQYFATSCDVSKDGHFILTSSNGANGVGCECILWDVRTKKQVYTYKGHEQTISKCAFLPGLFDITAWPLIISASHDSTVKIWNQETRKCLASEDFYGSGPLTDVAVWEDGRFCVSSFECGIVQLCILSDGQGGVKVKRQSSF